MKDILHHISSIYSTLPPRQRKLAEYLHQNLNQAILLNSRELAQKAGVSEATVIRFITSLGFSGFPEFKRSVGRRILEDSSTSKRLAQSVRTMNKRRSILKDILKGDLENLEATSAQISDEDFEKAVKRVCSARCLYVLGLRGSYALAFYLAFNLRFFLDSVMLVEPGVGDLPEQLRHLGSSDVFLTISFRRYTREVVRITEKVKGKGAFIVALSDSELSPVAQLANLVLVAQTSIRSYFESFAAPMSLLNALLTAVALREKGRALPVLKDLEREFETFETFIP